MSEERITTSGSGSEPAANQPKTEAMPTDERQATPPTGNIGSTDPQAPTVIAQSAVDGGVPRAKTEPRGAAGRPGSMTPDEAEGEPQAGADGGAPDHVATDPSGEVAT